mgnify:CR=1 FL=1
MQRRGSETRALGTPRREWKILSVSVPVKRLLDSCWIVSLDFLATEPNALVMRNFADSGFGFVILSCCTIAKILFGSPNDFMLNMKKMLNSN